MKKHRVVFRVDEATHLALKKHADLTGIPIAVLCRRAILRLVFADQQAAKKVTK